MAVPWICTWVYAALFTWFFPDRIITILAMSVYLGVYLPWGVLPWYAHATLLVLYMDYFPREWTGFRTWIVWVWVRRWYFGGVTFVDPSGEGIRIETRGGKRPHPPRMYLVHPHGMFGWSTIFGMVFDERFTGVVPVGTSALAWIPAVKETAGWIGMIPADKPVIIETLRGGRSIVMVPDGVRGALSVDLPHGLPPQKRRGFAECAVRAGAEVVVVWAEGQNALYRTWHPRFLRGFQNWMLSTRARFSPMFCWGLGLGPLPLPRPFTLHFSAPIRLNDLIPPGAAPDHEEQIALMQDAYYTTLAEMKRR